MTKKFYLETFKKCPGPVYFTLLVFNNFNIQCVVKKAKGK